MRKTKIPERTGYTILLVDDSPAYLEATCHLLEREGHTVMTANSGPEAVETLKGHKIDLLLLDYYMPGMTGEEVVVQVRQFNQIVQIILQTGYASEQPPRELLHRLDIQGYYDKSEGPEKLLLWTDVGLKAAYSIQLLTRSRQGLQYILDVTPDMHKIQSLNDLLQGILWQVTGLLGVVNSFLAVFDDGVSTRPQMEQEQAEGFLAMLENDTNTDLVIRASTGRFAGHEKVSDLIEPGKIKAIQDTLQQGTIKILADATYVPLQVGEFRIGMIYLDRQVNQQQDQDLLNVFSNQASVAIQNAQLYEMATTDHLTGLFVRSFFQKWLYRELRAAFRAQQTISLLMIDLDKFKQINDQAGHAAGDQALVIIGDVLRKATRSTDIVGRYGGDEFAILLPQTGEEGVSVVGQRIIRWLKEKKIRGSDGDFPLMSSVGVCILEAPLDGNKGGSHIFPPSYFEDVGLLMLKCADDALYESKNKGGDQLFISPALQWPHIATE